MTLQTFGPVLVQDPRTKKGVPVTTAVVTDPFTGDPIPTFDLDGNARMVTTDSRGIAAQWQADTSAGVVALDFGGVQLHQISLEFAAGAQAAAEAAQAAAETAAADALAGAQADIDASANAAAQAAALVNAPSDVVAAALMSNPGTQTKAVLDGTYLSKGSAVTAVGTGVGAVKSKNLYNPDAAIVTGYVLSSSAGTYGLPVASAVYTTTDFVPVTAGATYTLSNPRNACWYDSANAPIAASFVNNTAMTNLTITAPAGAAYMRASFQTASYAANFQIEAGSAATAYVPFSVTIPGLDALKTANQALTAAAQGQSAKTLTDAMATLTPSNNMFNPADPDVTADSNLKNSLGSVVVLAGYTVTGFMPVTAGSTYTFSNPRNVAVYNSSKAGLGTVGTGFFDNPGQGPLTITVAAGGAYVRATVGTAAYLPTFQAEPGSVQTAYIPYGGRLNLSSKMQQSVAATAGSSPLTAVRAGNTLRLDRTLDGKTLSTNFTLANSASNGGLNIESTTLDGVTIHQMGDDVTPLRTQLGTVGANHGYSFMGSFTNPDGKTTADLGSRWTDGTREYVLLAIDGTGKLIMGGSYTTSSGIVSSSAVNPTVNLTHVAGATHTGAIDYTTRAATSLFPSVGRMTVTVWVDGAQQATDGTLGGRMVEIRESYEVLDYASLYDLAKANVGVSYTALPVAGAMRVTNTFRYSAGGRCRVSSTLTELKPTTLAACGFLQSVPIQKSGATLTRFVPGVATIGSNTWGTGVDMTSYASNDIVTSADLLSASVPPAFHLDRLTASGATVVGYAMGYLPWGVRDSDASTNAARLTNAATNFWDLRSTKKSYPTVVASKAAGWGRLTVEGFRCYLSAAQTDAVVSAGPDALIAWTRLDTVASLS